MLLAIQLARLAKAKPTINVLHVVTIDSSMLMANVRLNAVKVDMVMQPPENVYLVERDVKDVLVLKIHNVLLAQLDFS